MHLRTLPDGQKVYSLAIIDGIYRVLLSDEVCLSKGSRDAALILLRAFAYWGLPEETVCDNVGPFADFLYRIPTAPGNTSGEGKLHYPWLSMGECLRVHWPFRNDDVKTPLGDLGTVAEYPLPYERIAFGLMSGGLQTGPKKLISLFCQTLADSCLFNHNSGN